MNGADIIDRLGGSSTVAKHLGQRTNTVGNWRRRGIPWRYRQGVARLAEKCGVRLAPSFLDGGKSP